MDNEPAEPPQQPPPFRRSPKASNTAWLEQAQRVAAVVALGGVLVFGVLLLAYAQFYRELGVSLNDVGVEYGKALGGAAGLTIVGLVSTPIAAGALWLSTPRLRERFTFVQAMFGIFVLLALIAAVGLPRWANARASAVKHGRPVESVRVLGVEILSVRAAPASVQLIKSEEDTNLGKYVQALKHPLFYLGQGRGQVVLYEQPMQRAILIPSGLVGVLQTSNCETHFAVDKICGRVVK